MRYSVIAVLAAGDAGAVQRDLLAHLVAPQIVLNPPGGWPRLAENDAQIAFLQLVGFDAVVEDAQRLGRFRGDDDAARVAVDAVAQRGRERRGGVRVPRAGAVQIRLNVRDERIVSPRSSVWTTMPGALSARRMWSSS